MKITESNSFVKIQTLENNTTYTDWNINGTAVSDLFNITIPITEGGTEVLSCTNSTYALNNIYLEELYVRYEDRLLMPNRTEDAITK